MLGPDEVVEFIKSGLPLTDEIEAAYGIIPRAIRDLFIYVNQEIDSGSNFKISMNYFEIYNEILNSLLGNPATSSNLKIQGKTVLNANPIPVHSPEEIFKNI